MKRNVRSIIRLYWMLNALAKMSHSVIATTYVMYLLANGLTLLETNLVNTFFFVTLFITELPTGAIADVFGRKVSFLAYCLLHGIGFIMYGYCRTFWGFAFAEVIGAVAITFSNGAFDAWLIDTLKYHGCKHILRTTLATSECIGQGASLIGALIGGWIGSYNLALPWIIGGMSSFATGVVALVMMREEYTLQESHPSNRWARVGATMTSSIRFGIAHPVIRFTVLVGTIQSLALMTPNMLWQPYVTSLVHAPHIREYVFALVTISLMIGSLCAPTMLAIIDNERRALIWAHGIIGIGIALTPLMPTAAMAIAAFLLHEVGRGLFKPLKDTYLNDRLPTSERATLLSLESIAHHIGGTIGLVLNGVLAQFVSVHAAWSVSGFILLASAIALFVNHRSS